VLITKSGFKYIINEIRSVDSERQLKLLECFLEDGDVFLFAHYEPDIKSYITNLSDEDKDFYCDGFIYGYIELYS
jgi:hypothetical protein